MMELEFLYRRGGGGGRLCGGKEWGGEWEENEMRWNEMDCCV